VKRLLFDSESDGLLAGATKLHCFAMVDVDTEERLDFKPHEVDRAVETIDKADTLIGHNIMRHDIPLVTKLKGWRPRSGVLVRDTMICARTIYPNVKDTDGDLVRNGTMPPGKDYRGRHTIAAWGYRLGCPKGDYAQMRRAWALANNITDEEAIIRYTWGTWNPEMHEYMLQDRETNLALWRHLDVDNYSKDALDLEHRIQRVCDAMEHAGVPFDVEAAGRLQADLLTKKHVIEKRLVEQFGFWYQPVTVDDTVEFEGKTYPAFIPKVNNKKVGYVKGQPCTKLKQVTFNPGSRDHIAKVLIKRGWKPEKFTPSGRPEMDEEVIEAVVARFPEMDGLGDFMMLDKRLGQLADGDKAWMKYVKDDGCIHGVINPMGTTTSRGAHMWPNLGQVPNMASPYGKECRSLFYAPPGWTVVGADESGLELRGLAHYLFPLDGGRYATAVLEGDVHWVNAQAMGLSSEERDKHNKLHTIIREDGSKRFIYAYVYGAYDFMCGTIIYNALSKTRKENAEGAALYAKFFGEGEPSDELLKKVGSKVRRTFANRIVGFQKLKDRLGEQLKRFTWVPGLDGRRVPIRAEHSALNFLIQSAGAIICKRWVCDAFDELVERFGYDWENPWNGKFVLCLWVHDEVQVWCRSGLEEEIKEVLVRKARETGAHYGFRLPLGGDAKHGKSWAETH
jgi:DNA polymerase-1